MPDSEKPDDAGYTLTDLSKELQNEDLRWALDVRRAYRYLGQALSPSDAKTSSCLTLHEWAQESATNKKEFLKNFVPKAEELIRKYATPDENEEILREEKRSIAELQRCLEAAVAESQELDLLST